MWRCRASVLARPLDAWSHSPTEPTSRLRQRIGLVGSGTGTGTGTGKHPVSQPQPINQSSPISQSSSISEAINLFISPSRFTTSSNTNVPSAFSFPVPPTVISPSTTPFSPALTTTASTTIPSRTLSKIPFGYRCFTKQYSILTQYPTMYMYGVLHSIGRPARWFRDPKLYSYRQYSSFRNDKNTSNSNDNTGSTIKFRMSWDFKAFFARFRKLFSFFKKGKPLTADHIFAIFSWAVFGTTFWIVVGTTTLLSSVLWIVNTLRFQEWVALRVGAYLTKQSGVHISFESAVGNWKQGTIRVQNVILAREGLSDIGQSAIYLTIDKMDVKISLLWMLEGKGILRACKASGVRGFVDRRPEAIYYSNNPNYTPPSKRTWRRGDLEMENLSVSDLLIQLYLPDPTNTRPRPISIYTMECDRFRYQWLFLDLLSAKSVVGKFDGCLFTFGIPQKEDITHSSGKHLSRERELKINGVPMSLLSKTATGPLGWIKEGTLDISLSITLPSKETSAKYKEIAISQEMGNINDADSDNEVDSDEGKQMTENTNEVNMGMEMRFDVMFNHLRVSAPLYTPELSYLNNAVVHPILAYMNSHSKHIPLSFDVRLDLSKMDGARTPSEAGLWDALSASVAMEFGRIVQDTQTTETLRTVANTLLKDCWVWLSGWLYNPIYASS